MHKYPMKTYLIHLLIILIQHQYKICVHYNISKKFVDLPKKIFNQTNLNALNNFILQC